MPVDLSSAIGSGAAIAPDRKVTSSGADVGDSDIQPPPLPLDYAPESFCLSKDAELEWLDQNAFIERKNSGKASDSTNPNPNSNSIYGSNRRSANLKSFFGLPKARKPNYADAKNRRQSKPASIQLFPNRSESAARKPATALSEPSSPKVSCMGRVRSRKDRKKKSESDVSVTKRKTGFWINFRSIFRSGGDKTGCKGNGPDGEPVVPVSKKGPKERNCDFSPGEPPGLGAINRFTSGRRSDAWASEIEMKSEPLEQSPIWRRRGEKGAPADVDVDHDWQSAGPASV